MLRLKVARVKIQGYIGSIKNKDIWVGLRSLHSPIKGVIKKRVSMAMLLYLHSPIKIHLQKRVS